MYKLSMDVELQSRDVAQALRSLERSLERFVDSLSHRPLWIEVDGARNEHTAVQRACQGFASIDYSTGDEVGSSVVCLGVIGASSDMLQRAAAVNEAKASLKKVCVPLQRVFIRVPVKGESRTEPVPAIRVILRRLQRSDLNLYAAYRKIPLLNAPPVTVTYTRANTRSVYRKSVEEIYTLLESFEGAAAAADRGRLASLRRDETHLALVRERYQNMRANVVYARLDSRGRGRVQVSAELPLIYAFGRKAATPVVKFPAPEKVPPTAPRRIRKSKVTPLPFLTSLPVYRYIDG